MHSMPVAGAESCLVYYLTFLLFQSNDIYSFSFKLMQDTSYVLWNLLLCVNLSSEYLPVCVCVQFCSSKNSYVTADCLYHNVII
jgi:hypothetical protein